MKRVTVQGLSDPKRNTLPVEEPALAQIYAGRKQYRMPQVLLEIQKCLPARVRGGGLNSWSPSIINLFAKVTELKVLL